MKDLREAALAAIDSGLPAELKAERLGALIAKAEEAAAEAGRIKSSLAAVVELKKLPVNPAGLPVKPIPTLYSSQYFEILDSLFS